MDWTEQELRLKELAKTGKLVWDSGDTYIKVRRVGECKDEPSPCAFLANGTYCALYAGPGDMSDFFLLEEI